MRDPLKPGVWDGARSEGQSRIGERSSQTRDEGWLWGGATEPGESVEPDVWGGSV